MDDTTLLRSEVDPARTATGYHLRPHGPEPVPDRDSVTPARATPGPARDMAATWPLSWAGAATAGAQCCAPRRSPQMYAAQYPPDPPHPGPRPRVLAPRRRGAAVVGPGAHPRLRLADPVAPDDGVGVMVFTNGTTRGAVAPGRGGQAAPAPPRRTRAAVRSDVPHRPEVWGDLCGGTTCRAGDRHPVRALMGAGGEVFVRGRPAALPVPDADTGAVPRPADAPCRPGRPVSLCLDFSEVGLDTFPMVFAPTRPQEPWRSTSS